VELDALSEGGKKFLVPILCLWLYYVKLAARQREELSLVVFVEEAHHVLYRGDGRRKETVMNTLLRQCREIGIAMVVVDQHPHLMSAAALGNTYTSICMNLKDPADIVRAGGISMMDETDRKHLSMLPVGQGVVKLQDRWRRPFVVESPLVRVAKGAVTDEVLRGFLSGEITLSGLKRRVGNESGEMGRFRVEADVLDEDELIFVEDVIRHQDDGVDVRYKRLGLSADKGNRIKNRLLERGWLEQQELALGRTRRMMLRLTPSARRALGSEVNDLPHGSISHEFWKRWYARRFEEAGYQVELEAPRSGEGRVDVLARRNGESVAIEVETGKSDVVHNVKQDLRSGFERVVVVATDSAALKVVERCLGVAGLLIRRRVTTIIGDSAHAVECDP